ncbi:MAG TPA: TetR/AcrR family transcriptional regulator [Polyangiales bacterium]|nr:TetR/AcrR family transcriptional regulator [Polyangiales bacterium]
MMLFWRHGYDGTSMAQLTSAMGVAAPSLYAAFGSKLELYREALALYVRTLGEIGVASLVDAATARDGVQAVLRAAATAFTRRGMPPGCMVGVGALRCAEGNEVAEHATATLRQLSYDAVYARLQRAGREGELPGSSPRALADLYAAIVEGMSVLARDGAPRARLLALADLAMAAWPTMPHGSG